MRPLSFRSLFLLLMVTPVVVTTVVVGGLMYRSASEFLIQDAVRTVGIAAHAREQTLLARLRRQQERTLSFLRLTRSQCGELPDTAQARCLSDNLADFVSTEGAVGARLAAPHQPLTRVGRQSGSELPLVALPESQWVRFEPRGGPERFYELVVQAGGLTVGMRFDVRLLNLIFQERYGLGASGESFLADPEGFFITTPKYPGHSGESHPIEAGPMRACLSGHDAEVVAPDYRGVEVIHGFRYIQEVGGGCIMAHIAWAEASAPARALGERALQVALLLGVIAMGVAFFVARWLSGPVLRLTETARALQEGNFGVEFPAGGPRELETFATTFARMAHALQEERGRLEEAVRVREDVVAVVSHDLRNPMSAISLSARSMRKRTDLEEWQIKGLSRIDSAAERALRMIRDLLDFTQARVEGIPVEPRPGDFHELVRQVVEEVQLAHPERTLQARTEGDAHGTWDADRLAQVITNLVGNAVQHSPEDTPIHVDCLAGEHEVRLSVHNEGPPIPAELLPHLFVPFRRGRSAGRGSGGSVGLGLYITLRIVEAHGGTITVHSMEGEGTTFLVRLPRVPPPA